MTPPRLEFLSSRDIQLQLVGGWLDGFGYELEAEEGADWSRFQNEHLQAVCKEEESLRALATVPLQSGKHAAQVLREAAAAGMPGAMIGTQPHGSHGNLDAEHLDEFWATAEELGTPIIVHPMFGSADARLGDFQMMNAVGRVTDITIAIARMLFTGHLTRFPKLKLVASTGGGALPYTLGRLMRNRDAFPDLVADPKSSKRPRISVHPGDCPFPPSATRADPSRESSLTSSRRGRSFPNPGTGGDRPRPLKISVVPPKS